jgi:uncharacterized damage-inducible protein DinB
MTVKVLQETYGYGYWANRNLFQALSRLSSEEFTRSVAGSYGSIRNTLVHTLSAEWGWLDRCGGPARGARLNPDDYPTLESVTELSGKIEGYAREFLSTLTDHDLSRIVSVSVGASEGYSLTVEEMMRHAAAHSIHHRGQVALLCRVLGHAPGNFDALFYYADRGVAALAVESQRRLG